MSAPQPPRATRNLTVERVLGLLQSSGRALSTREIADELVPGIDIKHASAALCNMTSRGYLAREKRGKNAFFKPGAKRPSAGGDRMAAARKARAEKRAADLARAEASASEAARAPRPVAKALRAAQARTAAMPAPAAQSGNDAPRYALAGIPDANHAASARIAADIAAFEAGGGTIQQLGPTQFFKRIEPANDRFLAQRAQGRATQRATRKTTSTRKEVP